MEDGRWKMEDGGWRVAVGSWKIADGREADEAGVLVDDGKEFGHWVAANIIFIRKVGTNSFPHFLPSLFKSHRRGEGAGRLRFSRHRIFYKETRKPGNQE